MMIQMIENNPIPSSVSHIQILDKDVFFKLLIKELTYQNPMEPMSNKDFVTQLAQIGSLEQLNNINQAVTSTIQTQMLYQATQMLGCYVVGRSPETNEEVKGKVNEVCLKEGTVYLVVGKEYIPLSSVIKILSR